MSKVKVLYVVEPRPVIGGGVRAAVNLAHHALSRSLVEEAPVFGYWEGSGFAAEGFSCPLIPFRGAKPKPVSLAFWKQFQRAIQTYRPDIVHVMGLGSALFACLLRKGPGVDYRTVITVHRVTTAVRGRFVAGPLSRWIARRVDGATFLTGYQRDHYARTFGFNPPNTVVLPNVIGGWVERSQDIADVRQQLQEAAGCRALAGYVGRVIPSKRLETFIRSLHHARQGGLEVGGVIVGSGPDEYLDTLRKLVGDLGVQDHVTFTGFVNTPERHVAAMDVILFPTQHGEALPNLIVEAFKYGVPVIASSIPQLACIVTHESDALVVDDQDPAAYAEALKRLLTDSALMERLSANGRATYSRVYDPEVVAQEYVDLYRRATHRGD